ncbi:MAG: hypothetical protein WAV62_10215, partial [Gemmiger qucibialis]
SYWKPLRNLLEAVGKTAVPCSDAIESGFCLELLAPYLRLFSFCDYTIQYPKEFVYSQISQTKYELFVHVMDRYCLDECGIINMLGVQKRGPVGWQAHAF